MRILALLLALLGLPLCSCERTQTVKVGGDDPTWISVEESRVVAERLMTNRYPEARLVSELGEGRTDTYRFATNGTVLPRSVIVDRKMGKAKFGSQSQ